MRKKEEEEDHVLRDTALILLVSSILAVPIASWMPKPSDAEIMKALEARVETQNKTCDDPFYRDMLPVRDFCRSRISDAEQLNELRKKMTP